MCKLTLLLFLGIASVTLTSETEFIATRIFGWIINVSSLYLQQIPSLTFRDLYSLGNDHAKVI